MYHVYVCLFTRVLCFIGEFVILAGSRHWPVLYDRRGLTSLLERATFLFKSVRFELRTVGFVLGPHLAQITHYIVVRSTFSGPMSEDSSVRSS